MGHSRPMQPVLSTGRCPFRSESDLHPASARNVVIGQEATYAMHKSCRRSQVRSATSDRSIDRESGIAELIENTQLSTTQQGRHTHPCHHSFTPFF